MNKYLVRNFKWRENLGKVPAKVYRLVTNNKLAIMLTFIIYDNDIGSY